MTDGRRHSVDFPLSKTLMTLKRVRSLRDPATLSMSKFMPTVNHVDWESNFCYDVTGGLKDLGDFDYHKSPFARTDGRREEHGSNSDSTYYSRPHDRKLASLHRSTRYNARQHHGRHYESKKISQSMNPYQDNSCSDLNLDHAKRCNAVVKKKRTAYGSARKLLNSVEHDVAPSRMGSPFISLSESQTNRSSRSLSPFPEEAKDSVYSGCGLSSCWSRTPKFKEHGHYSDVEDVEHPLLSEERRDTTFQKTPLCPGTPRSLAQKYRPKSFDELVGQHVVAQSLSNAISKGKISPIYVLHGPRGTGKTSMARIFAAALNCLSLEAYRPCGFCRECLFIFSGKSKDVKELDGSKFNRKGRVKSLLRNASLDPYTSALKVFIIDECQSLEAEAWPAILSSLDTNPRRVVFVMITSELDKLPHNFVSRCQNYHFHKIKDADIVSKLYKISVEEVFDFDKEALDLIASKASGSLRDAETMLDQLSLFGKKITTSLVYELIGVVSDDELVNLLDLALSSDTSNVVRRARELMSSKIDPMQLVSQLANLIMDILAGGNQAMCSEAGKSFLGRHALADAGLQKLRRALKILSETEKQLRTSKNQATWLTVALLQFSSEENSLMDIDDPKSLLRTVSLRDDGLCCTVSSGGSQNIASDHKGMALFEKCNDNSQKLEAIWKKTIDKCRVDSLRNFLLKEGRLSSVNIRGGLAIAEIEFFTPHHISKAEKSWKHIASSLQLVLGCNVEIRIRLLPNTSKKNAIPKKLSFKFLCCSRCNQDTSESSLKNETENETSEKVEGSEVHSSDRMQFFSPALQSSNAKLTHDTCHIHDKEVGGIRNIEGNAPSTETPTSVRALHAGVPDVCNPGSDTSKDFNEDIPYISIEQHGYQTCCFPKALKLQKKLFSSDSTYSSKMTPHDKLELALPDRTSMKTCFCSNNSCIFCSGSDVQISCSSGDEDLSRRASSNFHCWGASKFSIRKAWQHLHHQRNSTIRAGCPLPKPLPQAPIACEQHAY